MQNRNQLIIEDKLKERKKWAPGIWDYQAMLLVIIWYIGLPLGSIISLIIIYINKYSGYIANASTWSKLDYIIEFIFAGILTVIIIAAFLGIFHFCAFLLLLAINHVKKINTIKKIDVQIEKIEGVYQNLLNIRKSTRKKSSAFFTFF